MVKIKKVKLFTFILILGLSLTLTGCFDSTDVEDTLWDTYQGDNFVISYPGEGWHILTEEGDSVQFGNAEKEDNSTQLLAFVYSVQENGSDLIISSDSEWEDYKGSISNTVDDYYPEATKTDIEADGYSAYKINYSEDTTFNDETVQVTYDHVYIYDDVNNLVHILVYAGINDNYNEYLSNNIIDKVKIN